MQSCWIVNRMLDTLSKQVPYLMNLQNLQLSLNCESWLEFKKIPEGGYLFKTCFWAGYLECWGMPLLTDFTRSIEPTFSKMFNRVKCLMDGAVLSTQRNTNGKTWWSFLQLKPAQKLGSSKSYSLETDILMSPSHCDNTWCASAYNTHHFDNNHYRWLTHP
jgi:hypothetical protein